MDTNPSTHHHCTDFRLTFDDGIHALVLDSLVFHEQEDSGPVNSWIYDVLAGNPQTVEEVVLAEQRLNHGHVHLGQPHLSADEHRMLNQLLEDFVHFHGRNTPQLTYRDLRRYYEEIPDGPYRGMKEVWKKADQAFAYFARTYFEDMQSDQLIVALFDAIPGILPSHAPRTDQRSTHGGGTVIVDLAKKEFVVKGWPLTWEDVCMGRAPEHIGAARPQRDGKTMYHIERDEVLYNVYGALSDLLWVHREHVTPDLVIAFDPGTVFFAPSSVSSRREPALPEGWAVVDGVTNARYPIPVTIDSSLQH